MTKKSKLKNILFKKIRNMFFVFLIIFLLSPNKVFASFNYSDFDYNEFVEQTKDYWTSYCPNGEQDCIDQIIKTQEKFYTKLYKLLAKYQKRNLVIDDAIILATVFFEYSPSDFNDTSGSYNLDADDGSNYNIDVDEGKEFFEQETDTLKLLLKAMVGYERVCYGVSSPRKEVETYKDEEGNEKTNEYYVCDDGNLDSDNNRCLTTLKTESISFWEKYADKITGFFGIKSKSDKDCNALAQESGYSSGYQPAASGPKKVLESGYWDFLTKGRYFDNKANLYHRYLGVLNDAKTKKIEDLYGNDEYEEELVKVRARIVEDIKKIIEDYRKYRPESAYHEAMNNDFWWPIGSAETEDKDGVLFASGDPVSTSIISSFGAKLDQDTKDVKGTNNGIDIGSLGADGEANIIAVKDGTVVSINNNCTTGDKECGGGYGNYVEIQHSNGLYTFYAHLHEGSITVKKGDSVAQGQVIGKAGSTGSAADTRLHFEVRVGPSSSNAVDPMTYISADSPRPKSGSLTHVDGGTVMQEICLTLKASGFSNSGIAAVLTNINAESGFNPNSIGDGGTSYGLCQWHNDRWDNLKNYTSEWQTVGGQLDFLLYELESGYMGLYNSLLNGSGSAHELANNYCVQFERPADTESTCASRASAYSGQMSNYVNNNCN